MKQTLFRWLPAMAFLLLPVAAGAQKNVLANAPLAGMTEVDLTIARSAIRASLEESADGDTRKWTNPGSGASGTVKPTRSFERDGMKCRSVDVSFKAAGKTGESGWIVCKVGDDWKILSGS